jgi:hypothetical protein
VHRRGREARCASLKLNAGAKGTLKTKFSKAGRALLKKKRRLTVTLVLKLTGPMRTTSSTSKTVTVKLGK